MRIAIFGIENPLGRKVAEFARETQKFQLFGFTNQAKKCNIEGVDIIEGDFHSKEQVHKSLRGKDLVISTYGIDDSESVRYDEVMQHIMQGMNTRGIRRILAVANKGILQLDTEQHLFEQPHFPQNDIETSKTHLSIYNQLHVSKLDWTLVCPQTIINGERTKEYRVQLDYNPEDGEKISLDDLADFIVQEIKNGFFMHRRVGISY